MKRKRSYASRKYKRPFKRSKRSSFHPRRNFLRPEPRHIDFDASSFGLTTTPFTLSVVNIDQGDGIGNRSGNKVMIKSIRVQGTVVYEDTNNSIVLAFGMKKENGVDPANMYGVAPVTNWQQTNTLHYKVFWKKRKTLYIQNPQWNFEKYLKLNKVVTYTDGDGDNVEKNNIFFYALSDSGAVTHPQCVYHIRVYFKDF
nr:MAG: putative capsid protein [Arizlama virus]